jgi:hypothetical protein
MTVDLERLIRAAQERQAQRAVAPDRVRAALPERAARTVRRRRRRYGVLGAVAVAASVAAAVTVPALALRGGSGATTPRVAVPPSAPVTGTPGTATAGEASPLRFRPTWLPPGLLERSRLRQFDAGGAVQRFWTSEPVGTDGNDGGGRSVSLRVSGGQKPTDPQNNGGTPVDVNGKTGYYHGTADSTKSYVEWRADTQSVVSIAQHGSVSQADMLRIARSVQPDPGRVRIPLTLGWLPAGLTVSIGEVSGDSPGKWMARLSAEEPSTGAEGKVRRSVMASISPTTTAPAGGEQLTVGGHPARLVKRADIPELDMTYLVVDLGGGTLLTVLGHGPNENPVTRDDLIRVAEHATPDDQADASWIGTR